MNVLGPLCVASNGVTLYAVASSGSGDEETIILAQSNGAPTSLADLAWTTIATAPQKTLSTVPGNVMDGQVSCFVSSKGVFTLLSASTKPPELNHIYKFPAGFQYNPATKIWIRINVSSTTGGRSLEAVPLFNTGLHTMVEAHEKWALPASSGSLGQYAGANNNLFVTSYNVSTGTVYINIENPTVDGVLSASPLVWTLNIRGTCGLMGSNFKTVVRQNMYFLFCGDSRRTSFSWTTYDRNQTLTHKLDKLARTTAHGFLPLGPAGGPATWAFMYDTLGVYGVTLSGPEVGKWQTVPYKFNVTGAPGPGSDSGGGKGNGVLSTGALAGIIGGVVVVLGVAVFALWRKKKASPRSVPKEQPHNEPPHPYPMRHQKDEPYPEPAPKPPVPMVQPPFMSLDTKYYPPPESVLGKASYWSPHTSSSHTLSSGYPSMSPLTVTSTLADSEMNSSITNRPHRNASLPSTKPQFPQPNSALPSNQRAPQIYPKVGAPQEYGRPQERPPRSQARRAPSQAHTPPQMYPAVAAPQYYGEAIRTYPPPPLA
ncbi:hypothetical protein BGZ82_009285 [Podila clonocystis]|nr:hypothetical protein BGZ82_009285 [Podila clonocystis]